MMCDKIGHFQTVCRTKSVKEVKSTESRHCKHNYFLGSVTNGQQGEPWCVTLPIGVSSVSFKVDSGADVSTLDIELYRSMVNPPALRQTSDTLSGAGGEIECYGTTTKFKNQEYAIDFYVINGSNLLGRIDASALGFPRAIEELRIEPDVFGDTGLMKTSPVNIKISENATPYHVNVARRVPIPLLPKVESELRRMQRDGVIKKITEPTPRCAPMVAAPKKPDKGRICIDLNQLNKVVQRERCIIPAMPQVLAKLAGSVCFSKLDASGGYWQLALEEECAKLTTFITPLGRFCMTRVLFGISSASEIFQRKMELLEGLNRVECYQDDIFVHGRTVEEHDSIRYF